MRDNTFTSGLVHSVDEALGRFQLITGTGSEHGGTACVMTALSWMTGAAWTDELPCAHPTLRAPRDRGERRRRDDARAAGRDPAPRRRRGHHRHLVDPWGRDRSRSRPLPPGGRGPADRDTSRAGASGPRGSPGLEAPRPPTDRGRPHRGEPHRGESRRGRPHQGEPLRGEPPWGEPPWGEPRRGKPHQGAWRWEDSPAWRLQRQRQRLHRGRVG